MYNLLQLYRAQSVAFALEDSSSRVVLYICEILQHSCVGGRAFLFHSELN